ncbi:MAG: N-acetylmuramoyl-L-alanine amidase [Chloroflexota bacterium]|jgi:N-acetylmuramoyl-L-alanine amidase|nr:N-acetylmuramoyl-L-alanine amidase [Chloroflexota bacterium]
MRHPANRHLHVSLSAAVTALVAVLFASSLPALAAAAEAPPEQYVVAVDAGHGGTPDNSHPERLFDPGVIGTNGLLEKDLTLDVARRLRALLEADRVKVVMTRDDDDFISIGDRGETANRAHANLFVSIHFNSFTSDTASGSLVLYPDAESHAFATTMAAALGERLKPLAIDSGGTMLKSDLWTHVDMPAVTVEAAYLTNPREAALMKDDSNLGAIAAAVLAGVQAQAPEVATRKAQVLEYEKTHAPMPVVALAPNSAGLPVGHLAAAAVLLTATFVLRRRLRPGLVVVAPVLAAAATIVVYAVQRFDRDQPDWRNRRGVRRRRGRARVWAERVQIRA